MERKKKYTEKMESMITSAYESDAGASSQMEVSKGILADFHAMWPNSKAIENITAKQIKAKYHTLRRSIPTSNNRTANVVIHQPVQSGPAVKTFLADLIGKANNLELTLKDGEFTVKFKV